MKPLDQLTPWELLGVEPGASADEIRYAYERVSARLAPGSLALYSIADREEQGALQQRLRVACLELLAESAPPAGAPGGSEGERGAAAVPAGDGGAVQAESSASATEFDGDVLRRTREAKGISLEALSHKTRIRRQLLEAVEAERFTELPQRVFLRGFVFAVARELGLDPERVWASYGRRWEAWSAARATG
jgi:flagellar biosynthesis protein FlhG